METVESLRRQIAEIRKSMRCGITGHKAEVAKKTRINVLKQRLLLHISKESKEPFEHVPTQHSSKSVNRRGRSHSCHW